MGGCALIGQSQMNIYAGAVKRLSSITSALMIVIIIFAAGPLIELIPLSVLVGIMMMVVYKTFFWETFLILNKIKFIEILVIVIVTAITVIYDLAVGVLIGLVIQALNYVYNKGHDMYSYTKVDIQSKKKHKIYYFKGDLMYSSVKVFKKRFRYTSDPENVILDAKQLRVLDFTGVVALKNIFDMYKLSGKKFRIRNMQESSELVCKKTKMLKDEIFFRDEEFITKKDEFEKMVDDTNRGEIREGTEELEFMSQTNH